MDISQDKTVVLTPHSGGGGGPFLGNALPNGYVLQGRYVIEEKLGAGGFGITYLAKHRYLEDMWVAIKEYLPEGAAVRDESSRVHAISEQHGKIYSWGLHRFLDEARLLRQFQHPNIVSVVDFFEANDTAYMVMDYVRGHSVQDELDAGRKFSEGEMRHLIYQLLDALNLIHQHGLYHRDISPDNILLREEDDSPVLIDFGSARYEMRMHGAERTEAERGHTPTAIFKQGYSPIEQYEGTTQGPYTDIYAFAATLYRVAFGVRPVDALKRSGEIRLTQSDPLTPAHIKGSGIYSEAFLQTLDTGLQLDPAARPQSIADWLQNLDDAPQPTSIGAGSAPRKRRTGLALLVAAVLALGAAGGAIYWFTQGDDSVTLPDDVPSLLARATAEFESAAFDIEHQHNARQLYLQVLNQDGFNTHALAGLSAANLLQDFAKALDREDRAEAVVLLDNVETEFKRAGVKVSALETGWQRLELLSKLTSLRRFLPEAPLNEQTWSAAENLAREMQPLPGGDEAAAQLRQALTSLRNAQNALDGNLFTEARTQVDRARQSLVPLGIDDLRSAVERVDERRQVFESDRAAQIAQLMHDAEELLLHDPLREPDIRKAGERFEQVLALDESHSQAQVWQTFVGKLLGAYDAVARAEFDAAGHLIVSAHKVAANAGFTTRAAELAKAYLDQSRTDWSIAQTREAIRTQLIDAAQSLSNAPFDVDATSAALEAYRSALQTGGSDPAFDNEHAAAQHGVELTAAVSAMIQLLDDADFAGARAALDAPEIVERLQGAGIEPAFLTRAGTVINERERAWNGAQAVAALGADAPLASAALTTAKQHTLRMLELAPQDAQANHLAAGIGALETLGLARREHNFAAALTALQQALDQLGNAGVDNPALPQLRELILDESTTWTRQQREQRIATLMQQAFDILVEQPLAESSQAAAQRVFNAIHAIDGGAAQASAGEQVLGLLQQARQEMKQARFEQALQSVANAEQQLSHFGERDLDKARVRLRDAQTSWSDEQRSQRGQLLSDIDELLSRTDSDGGNLQQIEDAYKALAGLDQGNAVAESGARLVGLVGEALDASRQQQFDDAERHLAAAREQLPAAGLDDNALDNLSQTLHGVRERWTTAQHIAEIESLLQATSASIDAAPLDDDTLKQATDAYGRAMALNESLADSESRAGRITSEMEVVFLLRAFSAELADHQYAALRKTLDQLAAQLPQSGLDGGLVARLRQQAAAAERDWRLGQVEAFIAAGEWLETRNLQPAREQVDAAAQVAAGDERVGLWALGLQKLTQSLQQRGKRNFDAALTALQEAQAHLAKAGANTTGLDTLRTRIDEENQRWQTLLLERDIVAWAGEAVALLNQAPFAETSWLRVDTLVADILAARADDSRGLILRRALEAVRAAQQSLQTGEVADAAEQVQMAQQALSGLGLVKPLQKAVDTVHAKLRAGLESRLEHIAVLLVTPSAEEADLQAVIAEFNDISKTHADNPIVTLGMQIVDGVLQIRSAIAETRFATATQRLGGLRQLVQDTSYAGAPVPALRELLERTTTQIAQTRPSPAEIYPIISVGLRKIAEAPLDAANLDQAESLLRNALGLQADESSALNGIQAITQLRLVNTAIANKDEAAAHSALTAAQDALASIGLGESTLRAAKDAVEGMTR